MLRKSNYQRSYFLNLNRNMKNFFINFSCCSFQPTLIHDSRLLPYFAWKASLISPRSISERLTMIRINVLSFVPNPAIASCKRSAKKSTFDLTHLAIEKWMKNQSNPNQKTKETILVDEVKCTDGQESFFDFATEFTLDGIFDGVSGHFFVFMENLAQLWVWIGDQSCVKNRFIGSPLAFTGLMKSFCISNGGSFIDGLIFVTISLYQRNAKTFEMAWK